jgi:hypothetical protein
MPAPESKTFVFRVHVYDCIGTVQDYYVDAPSDKPALSTSAEIKKKVEAIFAEFHAEYDVDVERITLDGPLESVLQEIHDLIEDREVSDQDA